MQNKENTFFYRNGKSCQSLYSHYVSIREEPVPFSWESVVSWMLANYLHEYFSAGGNILELGVENGGVAYLALLIAKENEILYLVDQRKTDIFRRIYEKLSASQKGKIRFIVDKTNGDKTNLLLSKQYHVIHIDAGHLYHEVFSDLERYFPCLTKDGMLIVDDMFQGRWPDVTQAFYDFFQTHEPDIAPFILAFNKVYFCRKSYHASYMHMLEDVGGIFLEIFGKFKLIQTRMLDFPCFFLRGSVNLEKRGKKINNE